MPTGFLQRILKHSEIILLAVVILALRIGYSLILRFDSDEPQHLHVVWAWSKGMLPYRDVFDNHAPLFQYLCAPLFGLIGERANIVMPMRWAMFPLYVLAVYGVFRLAAVFFPRRAALFIAVSGSLLPAYFLKSVEFRPDDLWAAVWFLSLAILIEGQWTIRRAFVFGLGLGVSFAVSMKTTLFVLTLALAFAILLGLKLLDKNARVPWSLFARCVGVAILGTLVAPAVVVAYFAFHGALPQFYYGVIEHNIVPGMKRWNHPGYLQPWFALTLAGLILGATLIYRLGANVAARSRMVVTFLLPGCYVLVLYGFWPDIPREDDLPLYPLIPLAVCLLAAAVLPKVGREAIGRFSTKLAWAVIAIQVTWLLVVRQPWARENRSQVAAIATILQLTTPEDYVMDAKSGAIYRQRPFFFALETITRMRMRHGLIKDDIRARLVETRTPVAVVKGVLDQSKSKDFIAANYLPLKGRDQIRVLGKLPTKEAAPMDGVFHFDVMIPGKYSIVDSLGRVPGELDGAPCEMGKELPAGRHEFHAARVSSGPVIFWDRALEKGYQPVLSDEASLRHQADPGS
ncbi:MAG: hypothetical protein P4L99_06575 [Chthoniobacter sp.]|nr:hypothetical protein [Chthoniobacter sp.]